ncbi:Hypothetical predicted protein [Olea europaea subsp. europaea]|uniref:Uncharacterized protein n=1 Tax=Olea europaea subsp. europaea TaxID=158383 RepID=A0A8S0U0S1_OLEEU|nr:Hypothetical predicted protein [Olea europaea subsp. europaea]
MASLFICINCTQFKLNISESEKQQRGKTFTLHAAKSGGFSLKSGTGKNKKNGNIFERWKCFECQGFGLKSCPVCGKGGLTPEQRGER